MTAEQLQGELSTRYLEAREKVTSLTDRIHATAKLLELADDVDPKKLDPQAIGQIGHMIATDACRINSALDDFHPL